MSVAASVMAREYSVPGSRGVDGVRMHVRPSGDQEMVEGVGGVRETADMVVAQFITLENVMERGDVVGTAVSPFEGVVETMEGRTEIVVKVWV